MGSIDAFLLDMSRRHPEVMGQVHVAVGIAAMVMTIPASIAGDIPFPSGIMLSAVLIALGAFAVVRNVLVYHDGQNSRDNRWGHGAVGIGVRLASVVVVAVSAAWFVLACLNGVTFWPAQAVFMTSVALLLSLYRATAVEIMQSPFAR
ncbi:hypothetical protein OIU34_21360 [Pararhizobium sp. BT-229]|uniref:hypothetical protein n=1 Tax=Pararhizobium sp. BT-229 TaxID=2986923 RepID=UPI0021F7B6E4|nr:hypothetical protein [Pararhizobium sp. BT-229]MCV9964441.1 hypothetical protein [Pararhizobium sp. BT-229]